MIVLALKILASAMLAVALAGIWLEQPALKWGGWLGYFPPAEGLGFLGVGGTFSAFVWYLRRSNNRLYNLLGSAIEALFLWCGTYHFVFFRDWTSRRWRTAVDGSVLVFGAVVSWVSARLAGESEERK